MDENNTTQVEKVTARPAIDRVNDTLNSIKNLFVTQEKMYEKNPMRIEIIKKAIPKLQEIVITEAEAEEIIKAADRLTQRSNKWVNEVLKYTNEKSYSIGVLKDKAEDLNPGVPKLVYKAVIEKIRNWNTLPIAHPCPWHTCRSQEFIKTEQKGDGLYYTACTGKHPRIETTKGTGTAALSVDAWNEICQS